MRSFAHTCAATSATGVPVWGLAAVRVCALCAPENISNKTFGVLVCARQALPSVLVCCVASPASRHPRFALEYGVSVHASVLYVCSLLAVLRSRSMSSVHSQNWTRLMGMKKELTRLRR
jgi:hypothetical protein